MSIGRRRHPIELWELTTTRDPDNGEVLEAWVSRGFDWGSIDSIKGSEFVAANAEQSKATARVTIAYREDLNSSRFRFVYEGEKYDIQAILPNNNRSLLTCMCEVGLIP